jgi:hypothetical protein
VDQRQGQARRGRPPKAVAYSRRVVEINVEKHEHRGIIHDLDQGHGPEAEARPGD